MATDLLKNIRTRIEKVGEIGKFPPWYITELLGFKRRWSTDLVLDLTDKKTGVKKTESLKMVRVWHRLPNNRWKFGGGFRLHPDVTLSQMESHAMEMSIKEWLMGIPEGGAKGGIACNPENLSTEDLIAIILKGVHEAIEARIIGPHTDRWAPDVWTNETIMKWIQDEFSYEMRKWIPEQVATVTGKPLQDGGMPGRKEATGLGLHYAYETFRKVLPKIPKTPTVILQGFGSVGMHFAKLALDADKKKIIVGVADKKDGIEGGVYCEKGLNIEKLASYAERNKTVQGFESEQPTATKVTLDEILFEKGADIFVPAALEESVTVERAEKMKIKVQLEGANGPTVPEADPILEQRSIEVIPDIYANSGGVLVSYFEWAQDSKFDPFDTELQIPKSRGDEILEVVYASLHDAFTRNGGRIIELQKRTKDGSKNISFRLAAYLYAMERAFPHFAAKRKKEAKKIS